MQCPRKTGIMPMSNAVRIVGGFTPHQYGKNELSVIVAGRLSNDSDVSHCRNSSHPLIRVCWLAEGRWSLYFTMSGWRSADTKPS